MKKLTIFNYDTNKVRTIVRDGEPWFVLKDVCDILDIGNSRMVADRLDDDEKNTVSLTDGNRGNPNITIVSEAGLYKVILRSDKPEADRLMRFITHEVLPSIRKTGGYFTAPKTHIEAVEAYLVELKENERLRIENKTQAETIDLLETRLDESMEYYSIKRVASINCISHEDLSWRRLKGTSAIMEREVRKVFDVNFGNVNGYHIEVWKYEYPHLKYGG